MQEIHFLNSHLEKQIMNNYNAQSHINEIEESRNIATSNLSV